MNRRGFSAIELLTVLVIVGIITAFGIPRVRNAVLKSNVRSAKVALGTLVVKARAAAVARGCNATVTLDATPPGTISIAVCADTGAGTQILGGVDSLGARFKVLVTPTSTLTFDPRGLATDYSTRVFRIVSQSSSSVNDSVIVNPLGQVTRQ